MPEDRHRTGSAPDLSLTDNLIMKSYRRAPIGASVAPGPHGGTSQAQELTSEYQVVAPSIDTQARLLSGGNLQRLIFAREIATDRQLLIAVQPSRGLDVGAVETVHRLLLERRSAGAAILLVSEDLDEILSIADRVAVMYDGRITGVVDAEGADIHELGHLMTGTGIGHAHEAIA